MARNGAGTYSLPSGNPVVTGSTISSTWANNTLNDMATALTQSISSDGQTTPTGNLPMGNYAHTGVADATVRTMYASAGQVQDSAFTFLTSPAGTNTMTATASLGMSAYVTGQRFFFVAPSTNTGACTLNINAIGAKSVTKQGSTALVAGDIVSGAVVQVVYDGTRFQLLNVAPAANVSSFSAGTTGLTPSTATTGAVTLAGTLAVANGGTGSTTLTANNVILGNGTSAVQVVAPGTSGNALVSNGTTWTSGKQTITSGTAVASTSGTSITFTGIPSWAKRITVIFNGVSTSGANSIQVQIGSGSLTTTGYSSASGQMYSTSASAESLTTGFNVLTHGASNALFGKMEIVNITGNTWVSSHSAATTGIVTGIAGGGSLALSGTLDRIAVTTTSTDTFDAGSINIFYE